MLVSGVFDLPWWGYVIVALLLTHITTVTVKSLMRTYIEERKALRRSVSQNARVLQELKRGLPRGEKTLHEVERMELAEVLSKSRAADRVLDAARVGGSVGALRGPSRAARQTAPGLMPACRGKRHPAAGGIFAAVARLRVNLS